MRSERLCLTYGSSLNILRCQRAEGVLQYFGLSEDDFERLYFLSNVLIGIDYHNWHTELVLSYDFQDKDVLDLPSFEERLKDFLVYVIKPCFFTQEMRNPFYQRYFCECIASFLYRDAKCVDDMLFLEAFSRHYEKLKAVHVLGREALKNPRESKVKYSDKYVYQDLINALGSPVPRFPAILQGFSTASPHKQQEIRSVFEKLRSGCEQGYFKDSPLFLNCQDILNHLAP